MNLKLMKTGVLTSVALAVSLLANAQKIKTQPDPRTLKKNQVYKNQKMYDSKTGAVDTKTKAQRIADNAIERAKYDYKRLKDPKTGEIPLGIRESEIKFSSRISFGKDSEKSLSSSAKSKTAYNYYYWKNRGPYNVGGRTRALAIDRYNENVILAGGVSGGLWRSENGGESWRKITKSSQSPSITTIVQDPRPYKGHIWYYGSGERYGNSPSSGGAFYTGTGIYKSINGGRSFKLLKATADNTVEDISPFDITNSIKINPSNGDLYVATFNGLHRSQDGGKSFTEVLAGDIDSRVEVNITSSGKIYATIEYSGIPNAGFFTSIDGDNWTNITPPNFIPFYERTIMGIDPSNEDTVYFFTHNPNGAPLLNKYNAEDSTWTDLSSNLPISIGGSVGNLNLQTGYNMVVKVHPTDSDLVFIGGTNLYRSTTGFTTPAGQESWIAGYSPLNNISIYTNQHPDHHDLLFYPSNPNKVLSANDGGVFVTEDITMTNPNVEPVSWTSLNNGYTTTQPYHVAFDPEANNEDLIAGFQDNGTWFTNSTDVKTPWVEDFGGDGIYSAIADGGRTRYVSAQGGVIYRLNFNDAGEFESFTRVQPSGVSGFSFVNPYILDPNNDNIMYMPIGSGIWRNNNLDQIPLFSNAPTSINWIDMKNTQTPDSSAVSSLGLSKYPIANTLYYGTSSGLIFKITNANIDNQEVTDISTGKGLPPGYVNDINVDPSNNNRVIATFSNYNIPSVFLTEDGGETWTDISGNLEDNLDGTGNGPSIRSTAFLGASKSKYGKRNFQRIFAATSTGLYYTNRLKGQNTVWKKENWKIGNAVTDEVVTRKDGFIAVSTHGNGLFSARFPIFLNPLPEPTLSVTYLLEDLTIFENSEDTIVDVAGLFKQSEDLPITIQLTNSNPELVTATLTDNTITLSYAPDSLGKASIGLIATSGNERVSEGFTITIKEPTIYEQVNPQITSIPSQNFIDFGGLIIQGADDFTIPEGNTWVLNRLIANGAVNGAPEFTTATVVIYNDNNGLPGEEIYNSNEVSVISENDNPNLNIPLPEEITLDHGTYWVSIYANLEFGTGNQWFWSSEDNNAGQVSAIRDEGDLFGIGLTEWTPATVGLGRDPIDQTFQIYGDIISTSISANEEIAQEIYHQEQPIGSIQPEFNSVVWPNPASDTFNFNIKNLSSDNDVLSMQVFDISGKLVHEKFDLTSKIYSWDVSSLSNGIYFVNLKGEHTTKRFKIVKK